MCACMDVCVYVRPESCLFTPSLPRPSVCRYCVSPEEKKRLEKKYPNWPDDQFATRIPKRDVGAFPPNGGTPEYVKAKEDVESKHDWYEYHTDFLPEELAHQLNGGFVSQRRLVKLPCAAPRNNSECIKRLSDLLTTSCPQTQLLLQKEIDRIVVGCDIKYVFVLLACRMHTHTRTHTHPRTHTHRKKFGPSFYNGRILKRNVLGLATDAKPRYHVVYEDDDEEELYVEEIVPLMQDQVTKKRLENAVSDLEKLISERRKPPEERNEFLFSFEKRDEEFFGATLKERRQVCASIHNYCVFSHTVESCRCDHGVSPWRKATACSPCIFHHEAEICKCDLVAMTVGQDESVFHAYILGTCVCVCACVMCVLGVFCVCVLRVCCVCVLRVCACVYVCDVCVLSVCVLSVCVFACVCFCV